jgi:hypothetical protein
MRLIHSAPLAAAILLAACGGDADTDGDGAISSDEVAAEAAGAIQPQPGLYRTSFELLELDIPGMPEEMQQQMQAQMGTVAGGAGGLTYCLTPEDAAANGAEEMAKNMAASDCTVARFDVSGGTISTEMQCKDSSGGTSKVTMDGQMSATGSTMTMTNDIAMPDGSRMQTKARVTAERTGDCPA